MLERAELAVGAEHAPGLGERARGIAHAAEDEATDDRVEDAVAERQRLGGGAHEDHAGRSSARAGETVG